jgi:hypothetical protein
LLKARKFLIVSFFYKLFFKECKVTKKINTQE